MFTVLFYIVLSLLLSQVFFLFGCFVTAKRLGYWLIFAGYDKYFKGVETYYWERSKSGTYAHWCVPQLDTGALLLNDIVDGGSRMEILSSILIALFVIVTCKPTLVTFLIIYYVVVSIRALTSTYTTRTRWLAKRTVLGV